MTVLAAGGLGAGLTGFLVVLALVVAAVFLFRSMLRHLRKVPPTFEPPNDDAPPVPPSAPKPPEQR
jgi:hypothetical protein